MRTEWPLLWSWPYRASLTLRQIGLVLFLTGLGTRAGSACLTTFPHGNRLQLVLLSGRASGTSVLTTVWLGARLLLAMC